MVRRGGPQTGHKVTRSAGCHHIALARHSQTLQPSCEQIGGVRFTVALTITAAPVNARSAGNRSVAVRAC